MEDGLRRQEPEALALLFFLSSNETTMNRWRDPRRRQMERHRDKGGAGRCRRRVGGARMPLEGSTARGRYR